MAHRSESETKLIAKRIKAARLTKFRTAREAHAAISEHVAFSLNTYQKHESGGRRPSEASLKLYARIFDVPLKTLLHGQASVKEKINNKPVKVNKQLPEKPLGFHFVIPQIRHIPVLTVTEIVQFVQNEMTMTYAPEKMLPLPVQMDAGPKAFGYEMTSDDRSMINTTPPSIAPGTICIIDPDRTIKPGDFALVDGGGGLMTVRQVQAEGDYVPGAQFTLVANNPSYAPILDAHKTWRIVGRVIGLHIVM